MKQNPYRTKRRNKATTTVGELNTPLFVRGRNRLEISKDVVDELTTKQLDLIHKAPSKANASILFKCTQNTKINNHFLGHETNLVAYKN